MRINDDWELISDPLNIILRQRKISKEEKDNPSHEYWKVEGYYSSPQAALEALTLKKIMGTGMDDLETICAAMHSLNDMIAGLELNVGEGKA